MEKDSAAQQHKGAVVLQGHSLGPFRSASGEKNPTRLYYSIHKSVLKVLLSVISIIKEDLICS